MIVIIIIIYSFLSALLVLNVESSRGMLENS